MARGYSARGKAFRFELHGAKELEKMLEQLPKAMSKTVIRNALKKAAVPIRDEAMANVPKGETGNLADSILISTKLNQSQKSSRNARNDEVTVFVGSSAPHAHLVEFGTVERFHKKGKYVGAMPADPFFTRAWDKTKGDALMVLRKEMWDQLLRAVKRLSKRAAKGTLGRQALEKLR